MRMGKYCISPLLITTISSGGKIRSMFCKYPRGETAVRKSTTLRTTLCKITNFTQSCKSPKGDKLM